MLEAAVVFGVGRGDYIEAVVQRDAQPFPVGSLAWTAAGPDEAVQRIVKGAFAFVIGLSQPASTVIAAANELDGRGFRVLAVAAGPTAAMKLVGLIALGDPPRPGSATFVTELLEMGVRTVVVTGEAPATAATVAHAVGLGDAAFPPNQFRTAYGPTRSQSSLACSQRTSKSSSRRSRSTRTLTGCAATVPMTRRHGAAGDRQHAGAKDVGDAVPPQSRVARVGDHGRQRLRDADTPLDRGQQHDAAIGGDASAVERGGQLLAAHGWQTERLDRIVGHGGCGSVRSRGQDGFDTQSLSPINALCDTRQRIAAMP
jgi:haloacid dehalogenase-like hydrolase